ncbi:MAG: pyrroloquinoline quinone biosynthesis protein PqqB [Acidobacteria bacterium]|nr:pyrroloquinoline quinone biosynthesis protein PqqB [Acidobacteriota bacterium]
MFQFKMLGTAAGGGFPQWNCSCAQCARCRAGVDGLVPRLQLQAAVSDDNERWFLLNASPDLRVQLEANAALWPRLGGGLRNTPIAGVVLTCADLDQVLGLLLLREFQPLVVYATALVRETLEANSFFRMMHRVPEQLRWVEIRAGEGFQLGESGIKCTPVVLAGGLPFYAREKETGVAGQASVGLVVEADGRRVAYTPSVPEISEELRAAYASCEAVLVDGTFWSDAELTRTQAGTPSARAIGHVPLSGADGTLALLAGLDVERKVLVHINNTNPILDPESAERRAAVEAGWEIGVDGWELNQRAL